MPLAQLPSGLRLSYTRQGPDASPALVCLPGPTDSWRSYAPVLAALPPHTPAVAVSLRGHGDSDRPPQGYAVADLASDVVPFLDVLAIDRAVLVGHSGSCLVARRVALDTPSRVAGLVLEASPSSLVGNAALHDFVVDVVEGLTDPIDRNFLESWVTDTSTAALEPSTRDSLVAEAAKVPARVWRELFASLGQVDDRAEIAALDLPTLLVWGSTDPLVPLTMQEELSALLRAQLVTYDGCGHTPRWEAPERFAGDTAAFTTAVT